MKDVELLILKSFAFAVARQNALPDTVQQRIKQIAESFQSRVADLDALARSSPLLTANYRWAYSALTSNAAERGMGGFALPADHDEDGPSNELSNIVSAPERYQLDEDQAILNAIDSRINKANPQGIQQALLSDNPSQALMDWVSSSH